MNTQLTLIKMVHVYLHNYVYSYVNLSHSCVLTIDVDPLDSTDIPKSQILENSVRRSACGY